MNESHQDNTGPWLLKYTRSQGIRLSFAPNGLLVVHASKFVSRSKIEKFIQESGDWIVEHRPRAIILDENTPIIDYRIVVAPELDEFVKTNHRTKQILVRTLNASLCPEIQLLLWKEASKVLTRQVKQVIKEKLLSLANNFNLEPSAVSVKPMYTRWGSCSKNGKINLSCFIYYLPDKLQTYVCLHELAHLKYHNHSPKFWSFLSTLDPNWRENRKLLRTLHPRFFVSTNL